MSEKSPPSALSCRVGQQRSRRPAASSFCRGAAALLAGALTVACEPPRPSGAGEWPHWRGPEANGVVDAVGLPETWSTGSPNIRWQTAIPGSGNSSPIVSHGRVFLTAAESDTDESASEGEHPVTRTVVAVDFETGELLWRTELPPGKAVKKHTENTYAGPTPATDGDRVFAHFGDLLAAVSRDGRIRWTRVIDSAYGSQTVYGAASSVLLTDDAVVIFQDREWTVGTGWLAAFDKRSGDELWRVTWDNSCCSYTTPGLLERDGSSELLVVHAGSVAGYDPATGEKLWSHGMDFSQPVASAIVEGDLLAISTGAHGLRKTALLRLTGSGKGTQVDVLWQRDRMGPETSSPVIYEGLFFILRETGVMNCLDALTGRKLWTHRLSGVGYQASLVAGDGKVYAMNRWGGTQVIAAEPQFRVVANNVLDEGGNASPAIVGNSLLLRTHSKLVRIDGEAEPSPPPPS